MKIKLTIKNPLILALPLTAAVLLIMSITLLLGGRDAESTEASFEDLNITFLTTPECEECFPLDPFAEYFKENGVTDKQLHEVNYDSLSGKWLMNKYKITQVPTLIIKGPVDSLDFMQGLVDSVGEFREDAFVVTKLQPPFYDLQEERIIGMFDLIYLDDETCTECYDISLHETIFERLSMHPSSTETLDISSEEGRKLVDRYFIEAVPTILLKGELDKYDAFMERWAVAGSIEEDGTYVLRQGVSSMGTYKTLPEGDIIEPQEPEDSE